MIRNYVLFGEVSYEFVLNWWVIGGVCLDYIQQDQLVWVCSDGVVGSDIDMDFSDCVFILKLGVEYSFGVN